MPYGKGINWTTSQDPKTVANGLGSTNRDLLTKLYKTSPIFNGYDHAAVVAATSKFVANVKSIQGNPDFDAQYPLGVDTKFLGTPDISIAGMTNVGSKSGKASDPSTPWTPNTSSPGEVIGRTNVDPDAPTRPILPDDPSQFSPNAVAGVDSLVNPSSTAKDMGDFVYGPAFPIALGKHPGEK